MSKISIIIPVYNTEKYLRQCLNSVINQTLKDIEIICVNDGSTDNSLEILKEYSQKDSRIKVIPKNNTGYGHTMNVGLDNAAGEYIGILEPDDWIEKDMLETLFLLAEKYNVEVVKCDFFNYRSYPQEINKVAKCIPELLKDRVINPEKNTEILLMNYSIWTAIYKRDFLKIYNIRFNETPGASYQDVSFSFQVFANAKSVYLCSKNLLHYRVDNENSSVKNKSKIFCVCDEFAKIENFLQKNPDKKELFEGRKNQIKYMSYIWNFRRIDKKFRKEFIMKISKEFKKALEQEKIEWKEFSIKKRIRFIEIAYFPRFFLFLFSLRSFSFRK
ncbi:MAG: glycosyltransferase [Elusimicrobiota bacterium]|jgi:glycosyltransferase involved in cell wall biosynthesis|nr:glycosyltransferase [Elusimicrobiota bacterium]